MTVAPIPEPKSNQNQANYSPPGAVKGEVLAPNPVVALKELVAGLQREQNKVQDLLSSLGFALRNLNNINQFLELTPLMVTRVTDAEGSLLVLSQDNKIKLEQLHCSRDAETTIKKTLKRAIAQINAVAATQNPNDSSDLTQSYLALDEQIKQQLGDQYQFFCTIILVKNNVQKGRLYVFSSAPDWQWTQTRRKLTQLIADQTAVAIANHELNVELSAKQRQDRELEIASEIQLRLLPHKCPKICGVELAARCKTASRVGGDYYDFIPTNYDQLIESEQADKLAPWSIVIGDVMGKGVPAGLIMTMTRGMLRAEVLNRHTPAEVMEHLNRVMYADLENSHRFVSMFYSEYDPKSRILSFTNAAHNPPLWWRGNDRLEKLDSQGMLIGLDPDSHYEYNQVQLNSGDIVIYYTDGFTDAVNQTGDRFDEENLHRAIQWACVHCHTPEAILEYLFGEIDRFTEKADGNTDDMTLVVMQVD